ncbi:MAG: hypothetical protein FDZ75_04910, partial [Actinobacteria bacterium]
MTTIVHIPVRNLATPAGKSKAERCVARIRGVVDVVAVASMHLVSVLLNDTQTDTEKIEGALRRAGFEVGRNAGPPDP